MTVKELYDAIGGTYDSALKTLMTDALIQRFILKIPDDPSCPALLQAAETMEPKAMFETAHAMKGVYANLGLTSFSEAASVITEEFRPGSQRTMSDEEVHDRIEEIRRMYDNAIEKIGEFAKQV